MLNISAYTNLKHTSYMCRYTVKQTFCQYGKANLMSVQWSQQFSRYVFSKVIECLEQNIRKQIDCKRPSNTKQMNWVQNI